MHVSLFLLPLRTWQYQALQFASSFETLAGGLLTFLEKLQNQLSVSEMLSLGTAL